MALNIAHRGSLFHLLDDPRFNQDCVEFIEDGVLLVSDGAIVSTGPANEILDKLPAGTNVVEHNDAVLVPGFFDLHVHSPQLTTVAIYGEQLLGWLNTIIPEEEAYKDPETASNRADVFIKEALRNGTTTMAVYGSWAKESVDALFKKADSLNMRLVAGKVMADRNMPEGISLTSPEKDYEDCSSLIERWHSKGRLSYAVTPRFAISCTREDMKVASRLMNEHRDVYFQTHLSENPKEVEFTLELFPECKSYLDVYDSFGLLGQRSIFGHCIHLGDEDFKRVAETGSVLCPNPPSNFFLGSGLFKFENAKNHNVRVALGTDFGAGNTLSMLSSMENAYKMAQLQGYSLSPWEAFYYATLGGAKALSVDDRIGNFLPGKEADFVVLDKKATPLIEWRLEHARTPSDVMFVLMMLGDDRVVRSTYVAGQAVHNRDDEKND